MIEIYTDGSCLVNPGGPGGWAYVISGVAFSGGAKFTTNNRMEIQGILESVKAFKEPSELKIYSDSQYAINVLSAKWNARANLDLIAEYKIAAEMHKVTFQWVRGHDGNPGNELADEYAGKAARLASGL